MGTMFNRLVIGVDCDQVLTSQPAKEWLDWLSNRYPLRVGVAKYYGIIGRDGKLLCDNKLPYDLSSMFDIPKDEDGMSFWKSSRLYSGMKPTEGAVEYTRKLKEDGHTLVCITRISGDSSRSKADWLKKWFPHFDGYLFCGNNIKEKTFTNCDVMIDDSLKQLNQFNSNVHRIWFDTNYYQEGVEPTKGAILCKGWDNVYLTIQDIKANKEYSRFIERGNVWAAEQNM